MAAGTSPRGRKWEAPRVELLREIPRLAPADVSPRLVKGECLRPWPKVPCMGDGAGGSGKRFPQRTLKTE